MQSSEILTVVDSVSTEKGLDKDIIFSAIEIAIASASQRHFHEDAELFVQIDRNTGEYSTHRNWLVFDETDEEFHIETHISKENSKLDLGEMYSLIDATGNRNESVSNVEVIGWADIFVSEMKISGSSFH